MNKILLFVVGGGGVLIFLQLGYYIFSPSFSELYRNFDGSYWPEKVYEDFVYECSILQQNGGIDQNIDCADWILTKEGNEKINEYLALKFGDIYK